MKSRTFICSHLFNRTIQGTLIQGHLILWWIACTFCISNFVHSQDPIAEFDFRSGLSGKGGGKSSFEPKVAGKAELKLVNEKDSGKALFLDGGSFLKVDDSGKSLQFKNGQRLTIQAWVASHSIQNGQQVYIIGKGRTGNKKFTVDNQNYALRLRGINGMAKPSFLFRARDKNGQETFHRWNAKTGFAANGQWHHIVMDYTFGQPEKILAIVDGKPSTGEWDMGGPTRLSPVVDEDQVWIGSSINGNPASTFQGWIRDLKIYKDVSSLDAIAADSKKSMPKFDNSIAIADSDLDNGLVKIEIVEEVPARPPPFSKRYRSNDLFSTTHFGLSGLPKKYARPGVIADRTEAFLVRGQIKKEFAEGEYEFLIRAKSASTLLIDNQPRASMAMMGRNASGHESVPNLSTSDDADVYLVPPAHQQKTVQVKLKKGMHVIRFETLVGGKGLRNELGEMIVAVRKANERQFRLLSNQDATVHLTNDEWKTQLGNYRRQLHHLNQVTRQRLAQLDQPYWETRHAAAKQLVRERMAYDATLPPEGLIDQLVAEALKEANLTPAPVTDDHTFLRRVYLDTLGVPPSTTEIIRFQQNQSSSKRSEVIDEILSREQYADHWVSYWQDVLAENPGILKPKLNNTGPFRFWIHESLLDNKPMDRFAAELIGMKGSLYGGGPAGFGQATQNDVPTAAKANVLSRAFLGMDLTCARCHDSPNGDFQQRELFEMAAMLNRKEIKVPSSSSVPDAERFSAVQVTLKPGTVVKPRWPFEKQTVQATHSKSSDPRRQLAELITAPKNRRFAQVVANRIWQRLMGIGLVEDPDQFSVNDENRELLELLADQLMASGYNAKHLIAIIMKSDVYQRKSADPGLLTEKFGARKAKRMTAEQIVDSLFAVSEKSMAVGTLSLDPEGRRAANTFLNLGEPTRAWQLTSLANERDRPALALPRAQSIVDVLSAFGWRESRPNPVTEREQSQTLGQPLVLANGNAAHRIVQASDHSAWTRLAHQHKTPNELTRILYLQILNREPTQNEMRLATEFLVPGFKERIVPGAEPTPAYEPQFRSAVSWSNHLHPEATRIKLELEIKARQGEAATNSLKPHWRERLEDLVWSLIVSPEFTLIQ